ncbi:MAG: ATP-binding protein [Clostridia bacterium]|nr:ATP-binding protein [Clostridia bacterium]
MLKRKIEDEIKGWLKKPKTALMISGARQVGKTWTIEHVLESSHEYYVEFNLHDLPEVADCFLKRTTIDDLISRLTLLTESPLNEGCVIFFDEVQLCPDIVTQIKFLVKDGRFRYILSGSLLGVELRNLRSAPVGYLRTLTMYPLDFEEFLQIYKVPHTIIESLHRSFDLRQPVDEVIHNRMLSYFNMYMVVGGMPAAVQTYSESKKMNEVMKVHSAIEEIYKMDFTQYEYSGRKLVLNKIYGLIPDELNSKNKRYIISDLNKKSDKGTEDESDNETEGELNNEPDSESGDIAFMESNEEPDSKSSKNGEVVIRLDRALNSFLWLTQAGVAIPVYNVSQPMAPLRINSKSTLFKLFMADVGMLTSAYGRATKLKILNMEKNIRKGAMFENVVSQELLAHGFDRQYYYSSKKNGELDFVIEYNDDVLPIEVKSGKDYTVHSALDNVMNIPDYGITQSFVFSYDNVSVSEDGRTVYFPLYMIMFITKDIEFNIEDPGPWPAE